MKKRWILLVTAALLVIGILTVVVVLSLQSTYFKKLSYDHVEATVYNDTMIIGEDGLFYLFRNGEKVSRGFSWLKSVNDFYDSAESESAKDDSDMILFEYYLARESSHSNYLIITPEGEEFTVMGDTFTLSEVALPYLIFTDNNTSRQAAISLLSPDSSLSSHSATELVPSQTFHAVTPEKNRPNSALYSHLRTETDAEQNRYVIYDEKGERIASGNRIDPITFSDQNGNPVFYWLDADKNIVYSNKGNKLSEGPSPVILSEDGTWAYQHSDAAQALKGGQTYPFILVFSAKGSFTLSAEEYDTEACVIAGNCLLISSKKHEGVILVEALGGAKTPYADVRVQDGLLAATQADSTDTIYLDANGKTLLISEHNDMTPMEISTDTCTVLHSESYDAAHDNLLHYHFTAPAKDAIVLELSETRTVSPLFAARDNALSDTYLITEAMADGDPLYRLYVPFSTRSMGDAYHSIETYSHSGIYWCLGTDYENNKYDLLDPVNNQAAYTLSLTSEDFSRLSFDHVADDILVTNPYDSESGVPLTVISLSRYEQKISAVSQVRYFALYRGATVGDDAFNNNTLRVKEIGQNLLATPDLAPVEFYSEQNYLILHSPHESRVLRIDEELELREACSLSYSICGVLSDAIDPSLHYLMIASGAQDSLGVKTVGLSDGNGNVLLSPYYDTITHAEGGQFIVSLRNAMGMVEYDNGTIRTRIDYLYTELYPLGDGGYLAVDGNGESFLYDRDKKLFSKPIQSIHLCTVLRMSDEDHPVSGTAILVSVGGDLYLHTPEDCTPSIRYAFKTLPSTHSEEIVNHRALMICYYDSNNALIKTDVVLPTTVSVAAFTESFALEELPWYASALPELQTEAVTAEQILNSDASNYIVKLYQKAEPAETQNIQ